MLFLNAPRTLVQNVTKVERLPSKYYLASVGKSKPRAELMTVDAHWKDLQVRKTPSNAVQIYAITGTLI
jgi:hypothetical protein